MTLEQQVKELRQQVAELERRVKQSNLAYNSVRTLQIAPAAVVLEHITDAPVVTSVTTNGYVALKRLDGTTVKLVTAT